MNFEPQVKAWIDKWALAELAQTGFAQVDIDELLDPAPVAAVRAMLDCMALAVSAVQQAHEPAEGMVVIPLPAAEDQTLPPTEHPTLAEVLQRDWVYGPGREVPGLYLLGPAAEQVDTDVEEYRVGLPPLDSEHRAYYRAGRTLDERERFPHEWSRALYVRTRRAT